MPQTHPRYSAEFRAEAIRLVRTSGKSKTAIAHDLGIGLEALRAWVRQAELDVGERHEGLRSEELAELRRLRREVKILREERELLVTAAAFFGSPSRGRPTHCHEQVRVRRAVEGQLFGDPPVSCPRCLPERLLGVAQTWTIHADAGEHRAAAADHGHPCHQPRHLRRAADSRGVARSCARRGSAAPASAWRA